MYVPRNVAVFTTLAEGSVANVGKSWIYVAIHVRTAANPTRLKTQKNMDSDLLRCDIMSLGYFLPKF